MEVDKYIFNKKGQAISSGFVTLVIIVLGLLFLIIGVSMLYNAYELEKEAQKPAERATKGIVPTITKICIFWKNPGLYIDTAMPDSLPTAFESAGMNEVFPCKKEPDKIENCILKCEAIRQLSHICDIDSTEKNLKLCASTTIRSVLVK